MGGIKPMPEKQKVKENSSKRDNILHHVNM